MFLTDFMFRQNKILLTARNVRLDSGRYATKYYGEVSKINSTTDSTLSNLVLKSHDNIDRIIHRLFAKSSGNVEIKLWASVLNSYATTTLESVQDFLIKLVMKPCMHLVEISIFH